jgi:methyl-accepting chemotaxis protein
VTEHSFKAGAAHFNQVIRSLRQMIRSLREERDRLASMANAFDPAIQKVST